ncbi:MAG: class I SAM-dependent methyltransferase [Alphaproteobacteria bacterium]|jgi:SAM-dependent methyltransferase|nr:class I SAM-dependent methyltransferase [Alphaproteobacteria bacterium]
MNDAIEPTTLAAQAETEFMAGNFAGAVLLADRARAAGDDAALVTRAHALLLSGDYGGAAQSAFTAQHLDPTLSAAPYLLAAAAGRLQLADASGAPITQEGLLAEARRLHPEAYARHAHLYGPTDRPFDAYGHVDGVALERALRQGRFRAEDYYQAIAAVARRDADWAALLKRAGATALTPFTLTPAEIETMGRQGPWLVYWTMQVNTDLVIEAILGAARRYYAGWLVQRAPAAAVPYPQVLLAIASQSYLNEFIGEETGTETALADRLAERLANGDRLDDAELLVLGSYRDLGGIAGADRIDRAALGPTALQFLAMTIDDAADRQRIAKDIATVTRLPAGASQEVRAFYEATPYPRWHQFARPPTADRSFDEIIAADAAYLLPGSQPVGEPTEVLVAGCGTGSAIVPVLSYRGARITAFDLSLTSLAYARQRLTALGHDEIRYVHGDLLAIADMGARFDLVECTGVLHHLDDPWPGVAALAGVLKTGGRAMLSVYSRPFRQMMAPFMEASRKMVAQTPGTVTAKVRAARRDLIRQRLAGAQSGFLFKGSDLFTTSGFRDLLLHPVERPMTVTEFAQGCARHGLKCLGLMPTNADQARLLAERGRPADMAAEIAFWSQAEAQQPLLFSTMICLLFEKVG